MVAKATNKLEPLLTPNTYGPAKGLRNRLCINNPHKAKPDPARIDVIAFGKRMSIKIVSNMASDRSNENKLILPKHKSPTNNTIKKSVKPKTMRMNLE